MMRLQAYRLAASRSVSDQKGQALLESLIAMLALAVLWGGLHWLAHYQDAGLSAMHASRYAAFIATRLPSEEVPQALVQPFFSGPAHRWTDLRGQAVLNAETVVSLSWQRLQPVSTQAQPGGNIGHAAILRRDWGLQDDGILRARVTLEDDRDAAIQSDHGSGLLKLGAFSNPYPSLARSTGILTGAGHASSDTESQARAASSGLAWAAAYSASRFSGGEVERRAAGVDAGWDRPEVGFDWWQPWTGRVPGHLLVDFESVAEGRN